MGYRDSDESSFSRHGMGGENDDYRHSHNSPYDGPRHAQQVGFDRSEPRTGYAPELDERTDRYDQYGMVRSYGRREDNRLGDRFDNRFDNRVGNHFGGRFAYADTYAGRPSSPDPYRANRQALYPANEPFDSEYQRRQSRTHDRYFADAGDNWGDPGYRDRPESRQTHSDPNYLQWRQEQLRLLDDDYHTWRNERYQKFADDFNTWRSAKQSNAGTSGSPANPSQTGKGQGSGASGNSANSPNSGSAGSSGKSRDTN